MKVLAFTCTIGTILSTLLPVLAKQNSITSNLQTNEDFTILSSLIEAADLSNVLEKNGPITLFAPSDKSFSEVNLNVLMDPQWQPHLQTILSYHIVQDELFADNLTQGLSPMTMEGNEITIVATDPKIRINDNVNITEADIIAQNGIIHKIDDVLLPPFVYASAVDLVAGIPEEFSIFVDLLNLANMTSVFHLAGPGPFTVLAPNNAAWEKLGPDTMAELTSEEGAEDLRETLLYHIIPAIKMSNGLKVGDMIPTLSGDTLKVTSEKPLEFDGWATVTEADTLVYNGIVTVLDTVLIPGEPVPEDGEFGLSSLDLNTFISYSNNHTIFANLLKFSGFDDILEKHFNDNKTITLFAPDDHAWQNFGALDKYKTHEWNGHLLDLLYYHLVDHSVYTSEMSLGYQFEALNYGTINVSAVDPDITLNYDVGMWESDINASNGVLVSSI